MVYTLCSKSFNCCMQQLLSFMLYAIMQIGKSTTMQEVKDLDAAGNITRNLNMSALKDTITVPDGGYSIVRIHATNPGTFEFPVYCMQTSQFKVCIAEEFFFLSLKK